MGPLPPKSQLSYSYQLQTSNNGKGVGVNDPINRRENAYTDKEKKGS